MDHGHQVLLVPSFFLAHQIFIYLLVIISIIIIINRPDDQNSGQTRLQEHQFKNAPVKQLNMPPLASFVPLLNGKVANYEAHVVYIDSVIKHRFLSESLARVGLFRRFALHPSVRPPYVLPHKLFNLIIGVGGISSLRCYLEQNEVLFLADAGTPLPSRFVSDASHCGLSDISSPSRRHLGLP